jgi:hypothetical protein
MTEPFANTYSFGFQKGKCAHMAVGEIAAILDTKTERVRKVCDNRGNKIVNILFLPNG